MINKTQSENKTWLDKNNCKVSVDSHKTIMSSKFAEALRRKLSENALKPAELARRAKTTRANISRLLNDTPHSISGAPPRPLEETVIKIAQALDWNVNEALLAAGYAPLNMETGEVSDELMGAVYYKYNQLTPEKRAEFRKILEMVDKELDKEINQ